MCKGDVKAIEQRSTSTEINGTSEIWRGKNRTFHESRLWSDLLGTYNIYSGVIGE